MPRHGLLLGLLSGVLYGSVNVGAKAIGAPPIWTACLAYLAGGLALAPFVARQRIARRDWPKVLAMGVVGGGVSPALLFLGLREASAVDAGLLLTLELAATALLAVLFLGEREGPRGWTGIALLAAAAVLVSLSGSRGGETSVRGALLVLASALGWGIDNAVSTRLVGHYKVPGLLGVKAWLGGLSTLALAAVFDAPIAPRDIPPVVALGLVAITLSSLCYYHALRRIGAARTSAVNVPTTALVGAVGGALLLGETIAAQHLVAFAAAVAGVLLLAQRNPTATGPA